MLSRLPWFLAFLLGWSLELHAVERTLTWPNGDVYVGDVKDGQRHGRGRMKYANGREYVGEWVQDKRQGFGEQTWKNSPKYLYYKGQWIHDLPGGTGTMAFPVGQIYSGEFQKARMQGQGQMAYADGSTRFGTFVQNKREGEFLLITADGRQYTETFVQDKRTSIRPRTRKAMEPIRIRGSFELLVDDYRIPVGLKVRGFGDNTDLPRLGVEVDDVIHEMCGYRMTSTYDYQKADGILMTKEKPCTIKLTRKGQTLTLNDIN